MLLAEVAAASARVAATRSRTAKVAVLAALLRQAGDEVEIAASWLGGALRQRRTGIGWRSLTALPDAAASATLTLAEVDAELERIGELSGPGSQTARRDRLAALFGRATAPEQEYLAALITGALRQGALDGLLVDAVAEASGLPLATVRRAAMLAGSTPAIARAALGEGDAGLAAFTLTVFTPVLPMLAASAGSVAEALAKTPGREVAIEAKLDGIRIQAHRHGDRVRLYTRSLDDVTERLPEVVEAVRRIDAATLVVDGEVLTIDAHGRPRPFQETAARTASVAGAKVTPFFFDALLLDAEELLDRPLAERAAALAARVPAAHLVQRVVTADPAAAESFAAQVLAQGHEGVVVKDQDAPYDAGRRGSAWIKVKPVHTLDLVVLAVEWGSGRRRGWLSNIHLGARSGDGFVMLGKTFKGMTDAMLAWQTERFLGLETHREGHTVYLRPEQVVEIAFDGLQRSTRYPGGLALRFARVLRYRDDKAAADADTIETVRSFAL
ncbi:MAG: ATP-dependent DNA ligase [Actinomycetes bacterium]